MLESNPAIVPEPFEVPAQRRLRGVVAAHAVHAAAGRRRGGAEEDARAAASCTGESRATGRVKSWRRSPSAAVDVAADVVRVVAPRCRPAPSARAGEDPVAEARREPLDLRLDRARSCRRSSRSARGSRPTAVCLPAGARVGSKRLCCASEHVRPLRDARRAAAPRSEAAISSSVPPRCTVAAWRTGLGPPGDRPVERPVELEDARPVAVAREAPRR